MASSSGTKTPAGVHLVGSVPLDSTEEVFTKASEKLSGRLQTIPDGETGNRGNFVFWQSFVFPSAIHSPVHRKGKPLERTDLKISLEDIKPTKYDEMAISSYHKFVNLKQKGIIPPDVRFQVSIPTPVNSCWTAVDHVYRAQAEPLYTERLLQDLRNLQDKIPHEDLAIQIDCAVEFAYLEYERGRLQNDFFKPHFPHVKDVVLEQIAQVSSAIDQDVWLGYHLCYGDRGHSHFIEPEDSGLLADIATGIYSLVSPKHAVKWFHIPVPKERTDAAYFRPLQNMNIGAAKLYLGLVHENDEDGTKQRTRVAQSSYPHSFGVATECGMGRTRREDLDSIFAISREVSDKVI